MRIVSTGIPGVLGLLAWALAMCLKVPDYHDKDGQKRSDLMH